MTDYVLEPPTWWQPSHKFDPRSAAIAERHYNRQTPGSPQFIPPSSSVVLRHQDDALWVSMLQKPEFTDHAWPGAWVNQMFRNESDRLSSTLITEAVAHTRAVWQPPQLGMITFIDASKVRHKRDPGRCYRKAGWTHIGFTKGGLWVYQVLPADMPDARPVVREGTLFSGWAA